jgi:nitrate/nitrite transporter NarK
VDRRAAAGAAPAPLREASLSPREILHTRQFWLLWVLYLIGAGAGLMVIGNIAGMAQKALGERAFIAVALLAVGNAGGRIVAGILSDRIGRRRTLALVFAIQACLMLLVVPVLEMGASAVLVLLIATAIGFNYGANLAVFPAIAKGSWGVAHFGVNYGLLFTAWGVGGFVLAKASQFLQAKTGTFAASCTAAAILLLVGVAISSQVQEQRKGAPAPLRPVPLAH